MSRENEDQIYASAQPERGFEFDASVAAVFDDMVTRSVPHYREVQQLIADIASEFIADHTNVYDLGCSLGLTLRLMAAATEHRNVRFIGMDNSDPMLEFARQMTREQAPDEDRIAYQHGDLCGPFELKSASAVVMCLVLQFIRPPERARVLKRVREGVRPGGVLLIYEKTVQEDEVLNRLFVRRYHDMKRRNGYSELEVAQKRIAVENLLIPYRDDENVKLLHEAGFPNVTTFFQWLNFTGYVARA